jgi:hypothetical protein
MTGKLSGNIKCLLLSLFLLAGFGGILTAQTKINGVINKYGRVTSIGVDYVIVNDVTQFNQFHAGDTILLMQMKGVRIYPTEDPSYGSSGYSYGETGKHEFLVVLSVEAIARKIVFRNNIVTPGFDVLGNVQIIKVRSFNYAKVDATLSCAPWDSISGTGGVLAVIIGRNLTLEADIDVTGKGFLGGAIASGQGICMATNSLWEQYAYSATSDSAGLKGEGLSLNVDPSGINNPPFFSVYPAYAKGQGRNFNGGGGGNGKYSGGGGGSNYGVGGKGGNEQGPCSPVKAGGLGGIQIPGTGLEGGIFLGGGGGGSTNQGGTPSPGAKGGGIIFLICDTIKANGKNILAEGATPSITASGNAGAGGGGGGGSIALYLQTYLSNATLSNISANGGKGGNHSSTFGEGGGGGGGYLITNNFTLPGSVSRTVAGGTVGTRSGASTGGSGFAGSNIGGFVPTLNGFLFNSIISSASGKQVDSVCSNLIPVKFTGTTPVGGSGNYTYEWLKSLNPSGPWTSIASGPALKDYTPTAPEPATFWIRRFVKDNITTLKDTSKAVKIVVQPAIAGNLIGKDTTICKGQDPLSLNHIGTPVGGYGNLHYHWLQNTNNIWPAHVAAIGSDSLKADFDPSGLSLTTYYKRRITAGHCISYSNIVTITVLPSITGNITTRSDSVICQGSLFNTLNASGPGGGAGAGTYTYLWEDLATAEPWNAATGTVTNPSYTVDTADFAIKEQRSFRRVVYSGPYNTCKSTSVPILLTRYHRIKNNIIAASSAICSGFAPAGLTGSLPVQGKAGDYTYVWQQSADGSSWPSNASGTYTNRDYAPPVLTASTWYRRIVNSSVCTNNSNSITVTVQPGITNNTISLKSGLTDSTLCSGATPKRLFGKTPPALAGGDGSVYTFRWKISLDGTSFSNVAGATASDYQEPLTLTATKWYQRVAISGMCRDSTNSLKINVLPTLVNTIPALRDVCINTPSPTTPPIASISLSGGRSNQYKFLWESSLNGTTWTNVTADTIRTVSGADLDLPGITVPTKYRRKVWSGPYNTCFSASNIIDISIVQKPYPVSAGRDTTIHTYEYLYKLRAVQPVLGQGTWSLKASPNTLTFDDPSLYNTTVRNLASFDPNVLLWTVENGVCKLDATVTVVVMNLEIPDGISPNNDSKNDLFSIKGLDFSMDGEGGRPSQSINLKILNSAGTQVFHTSNDGAEWKTWDGKDDGGIDLPEGTYYYLLKIQSNRSDIKFKPRTGFIILKRK